MLNIESNPRFTASAKCVRNKTQWKNYYATGTESSIRPCMTTKNSKKPSTLALFLVPSTTKNCGCSLWWLKNNDRMTHSHSQKLLRLVSLVERACIILPINCIRLDMKTSEVWKEAITIGSLQARASWEPFCITAKDHNIWRLVGTERTAREE